MSASSLRLSTTSPHLPAGPWEDPALGDDVAELGGVHEAHHAIVAHPGAYSLPGWVSVQAALDFLEAGAKGERKGPLEAFLRAAGVVL